MDLLSRLIVFDKARELDNSNQVHSDVSKACISLGIALPRHTFNDKTIVFEFSCPKDKRRVFTTLKKKYKA